MMNIKNATEQDKIKALAELDGFLEIGERCYGKRDFSWFGRHRLARSPEEWIDLPLYLHSYDAIIPLVQKQSDDVLGSIVSKFGETYNGMGLSFMQFCAAGRILKATPTQICDAVLIASGKMEV